MTESFAGDDRPAGRPLKPPNRKKYEEDLEGFNSAIRQREEELKSLDLRSPEKIQLDIKKLRIDREQKFHRRQNVDGNLRKINEDIRKQESELTKVQSNLQYRSEHKINEAIQRLETQLKTRNFRLSEEKKIVAEIDSLKRSTKDLTAYLTLKKLIDDKRDQQRKMREERDHLQRMVNEIKMKEENIWQENAVKCEKATPIRSEIAELQQKAKELQGAFSAQEREYREQREALRRKQAASIHLRKEEDRRALEEAHKQEIEDIEAMRERFVNEKLLCNTLIKYLQRFLTTEEDADKAVNETLSASHGSKIDLLNQSLQAEGMFLLRRKSDATEDMQSARLNSRLRKNKKRPPIRKQIVHTPEIFDQFSQLHLTAPVNTSEVSNAISQLQEKLVYYESCSKDGLRLSVEVSNPAKQSPDPFEPFSKDSVASSANSYTESAVSGSMPTTPEVQFDATKLLQLCRCQRRLSKDSGTGDVDDPGAGLDAQIPEHGDNDVCGGEVVPLSGWSLNRPYELYFPGCCKNGSSLNGIALDTDHPAPLLPQGNDDGADGITLDADHLSGLLPRGDVQGGIVLDGLTSTSQLFHRIPGSGAVCDAKQGITTADDAPLPLAAWDSEDAVCDARFN